MSNPLLSSNPVPEFCHVWHSSGKKLPLWASIHAHPMNGCFSPILILRCPKNVFDLSARCLYPVSTMTIPKNKKRPYSARNITRNSQQNRTTVLNMIRMNPGISRSEISEILKLTPPTITDITRILKENKLIKEEGVASTKRGRKPIRLKIQRRTHFFLVLEIDAATLRVAVIDWNAEILELEEAKTVNYENPQDQLDAVYEMSKRVTDRAGLTWDQIEAVACGSSESVDPVAGVVFLASELRQWDRLPLRQLIQERFQKPCYLEDRTPLKALAEKYYGKARNVSDFIHLGMGLGIAVGIVINGSLYRGARGGTGEIGHVPVVGNDRRCICGNSGCLETIASVPRIVESVIKDLESGVRSSLQPKFQDDRQTLSVKDIVQAARDHDRLASSIVHQAAEHIGRVLAATVTVLDPELVVLGGTSNIGTLLREPITQVLKNQTLPHVANQLRIEVSDLPHETSSLIGALVLIAENHWVSAQK